MRVITKGVEPPSLAAHRQMPHSDFDNYQDKDALRRSLVAEQKGICCYCMGRIFSRRETMKIEHWRPRSRFPNEQLNYDNLLGACLGGEGQPPALQHCDSRKRNRDLRWNPADPAHQIDTLLRYEPDGSIRADDAGFDAELDDVLNLNLMSLKNSRRGVLDGVLEWWNSERAHGPVQRASFQTEHARRINAAGEPDPFCQVAIWWLEQRLARMPA